MRDEIRQIIIDSIKTKERVLSEDIDIIIDITNVIIDAFKSGKKLLIFGNGGSAADAQHIASEFINRFRLERMSLPAIALTTDTSTLTSISNDYNFDRVFSRQIESLANEGDIVLGISTSGNSRNVVSALKKAKEKKTITIGFTGESGGEMKDLCDYIFTAPSSTTPRIQEAHITVGHIICELVEKAMAE